MSQADERATAGAGAAAEAPPAGGPAPPETGGAGAAGMDFVLDVPVRMTVELGTARLLVRDVLQLESGSVVELDRASGEPADVLVNGRLVARGEVTLVDDRVAIKVIEVVGAEGGTQPRS